MNGLRRDGLDRVRRLVALARGHPDLEADIVVCPPATLLAEVREALDGSPIALGAQDCAPKEKGPYTGDISAAMLTDAGCRYVILGHSERRIGHGEDDALVRAKAEAAHAAALIALVCVGETEEEHDSGKTLEVVTRQLEGSLPAHANGENTAIAYEPVWAIGTGRTPTEKEIAEVQGRIREWLRRRAPDEAETMRLLYGGSVDPANAGRILALENVDGVLVGGASLDADAFWAICKCGA